MSTNGTKGAAVTASEQKNGAKATGTSYIVLEHIASGDGAVYEVVGESFATTGGDRKAIELVLAAAGRDGEEGEHAFVAVPARSFKLRTRKTATKALWS